MRKRDFSISDDKRISCLSFCSLCVGKKHRFRNLFPFGNLPLKRCFLFFIYDLISRSSIRRTAAFLSPLFSEILRPDRTRSGRCRICGCFQDRSDGSGLRTGRRARSKPSTAHPSQSSEVPDRSVCWRGSRLPLPQFFPGVCRRHGKICKEGVHTVEMAFVASGEGTAVYRVVDIIEEPEIHLINLFPQLHRIQLRRAFFVPWAEVDLEISGQPVVIVVDYLSRRCVDQRRNGRSSLVIIISTVIRLREELITEQRVDVVFIVNVFPAKVFLMRGMFYHIDGNLIFQALQLSYDRRAVGPVAQLCPDETVSLITFCLQIVFTVAERSREVIRLSAEIAVFVDLRYGFFWSYADFSSIYNLIIIIRH